MQPTSAATIAPTRGTAQPLRALTERLDIGWLDRPWRRRLQLVLGFIWLIDAALQYQPYMFGRSFVTVVLEPAAAGTPFFVRRPSLWAAHLVLHHLVLSNACFATIQLLIALAILAGPFVRIGLAASVVWALAVWWLGEGIGDITLGASAVMGAPGAAVLYALISVLVWPRRADRENSEAGFPVDGPKVTSVADAGPLGGFLPKALWTALWWGLAALGLEAANRSPSGLHGMLVGMEAGEPGWIKALDRGLAAPLAHTGTEWTAVLTVLFVLVGAGVWAAPTRRPTIVLSLVLAVVLWLAEDFGGVFTGSGTDVNTGPLIALLALTFWPQGRPSDRRTVEVGA